MTAAIGRHALGVCDICGHVWKLLRLRALVRDQRTINLLACPDCWEPDQPQLQAGKRPVIDVEALRNPRPENYSAQYKSTTWAWNPVAGFGVTMALGIAVTSPAVTVTAPGVAAAVGSAMDFSAPENAYLIGIL